MRLLLTVLLLSSTLLGQPPKVINLKPLLDCEYWLLDITYQAKDQREDRNYTAGVEMTATATYVVKRLDRSEASGHWQAQECQSHNLSYRGWRYNKSYAPDRLDYSAKGDGPMVAPLVDLNIGGVTPGYTLLVSGGFPAQLNTPTAGFVDHPLVLNTCLQDAPGLTGLLQGPLPSQGTTISCSKIIPFDVPPFVKGLEPGGQVQMSIQFVLKPDLRLAPLRPK